jgi:hypothetical protein
VGKLRLKRRHATYGLTNFPYALWFKVELRILRKKRGDTEEADSGLPSDHYVPMEQRVYRGESHPHLEPCDSDADNLSDRINGHQDRPDPHKAATCTARGDPCACGVPLCLP